MKILNVFIKTSTTYNELINNIIASDNQNELTKLKTVNDFNLFHLIRIKKFNYRNSLFSLYIYN